MLPSIEQYLHALQLPAGQIFSDSELSTGQVETNALGMPRTRTGNFVLVFRVRVGNRDWAVRCFTRLPADVERRYTAVSAAFESMRRQAVGSRLALATHYMAQGIRVGGQWHPIIKMEWATGQTMGEFVAVHAKSPGHIRNLRLSLGRLADTLHGLGIAHGDIQPGNLIVEQDGQSLVLIDYDGVYVPQLAGAQANEFGHGNFQHPGRPPTAFHQRLDRFSFIVLDLALQLLEQRPSLWDETLSDEEGFVFRANDFRKPEQSANFKKAAEVPGLSNAVQHFARVCLADFDAVPSLHDFQASLRQQVTSQEKLEFKVAPRPTREASRSREASEQQIYLGSYPILFAGHFTKVSHRVGQRIELIGQVLDVRRGKASFGHKPALRPYIYLDFSPISSGKVVRIKLLPDVLEALNLPAASLPNDGWIGKWVTITEVVQPVQYISHPSFPGGVGEASVHAEHPSQVRVIPESEARYRLASRDHPPLGSRPPSPAPAAARPPAADSTSPTSRTSPTSPASPTRPTSPTSPTSATSAASAAGAVVAPERPATAPSSASAKLIPPAPPAAAAVPSAPKTSAPPQKKPTREEMVERIARNRAILEKMRDI